MENDSSDLTPKQQRLVAAEKFLWIKTPMQRGFAQRFAACVERRQWIGESSPQQRSTGDLTRARQYDFLDFETSE